MADRIGPPKHASPLMRGGWTGVLLIVALAVLVMLPALAFDQFTRGDARFHVRWQVAYAPWFWSGDPVPRWLPDMNRGFGSPAFFLYPPLTQWAASLLAPVTPGAHAAGLRLALSLTAALAIGGVGAWRWLARATGDARAGLFGGLLYVVLPYHLYVDTYHRAAMAELWALAVVPWAFHAVERVAARGGAGPIAALMVALAALFLSHAPSALLLVPLAVLYAALISWQQRRARVLAIAIGASVVSAMIAGYYLATALTQTGLIRAEVLFAGDKDPTLWLIGAGTFPDTSMMPAVFLINALHVAAMMLALLLVLRFDTGAGVARRRWLAGALLVATLGTLLMQTVAARPLWALDTPLSRIQFPWRLLTVQTLAVAGGAALALAAVGGRRGWRVALLAALPAMILLNGALLGYKLHREAGRGEAPRSLATIVSDTRDAPEYELADVDRLQAWFGPARARAVAGQGRAVVTGRTSRSIALATASGAPFAVVLRHYAYSGWRYRIDDGAWRPANRFGALVRLDVPAGSHGLLAELAVTPAERAGRWLTVAGFVLLALWLAFAWRRQRAGAAR